MAKFATTYKTFPGTPEGRKDADEAMQDAAKMLTAGGQGAAMFAKAEKRAGDWQVNIYRR